MPLQRQIVLVPRRPERLQALLAQVQASGVKAIEGDIVLDRQLFRPAAVRHHPRPARPPGAYPVRKRPAAWPVPRCSGQTGRAARRGARGVWGASAWWGRSVKEEAGAPGPTLR